MLDFLHWSAALLALVGLSLWFWSGGIRLPQAADGAHVVALRRRQIRRFAIGAAVVSALLQAASASAAPPTELLQDIELWASAAPSGLSAVG